MLAGRWQIVVVLGLSGCWQDEVPSRSADVRALDFYDGGAADRTGLDHDSATEGTASGESAESDASQEEEESDRSDEGETSGEASELPPLALSASSRCEAARELPGGVGEVAFDRVEQGFRDHCGLAGLWRFFRFAAPTHADLRLTVEPPHPGLKLAIFTGDCSDPSPHCGSSVGTWLADVPAGQRGFIGLGADVLAFPELAQSPLPRFAVRLSTRPLLAAGDLCSPSDPGDRCQSGTRCVATADSTTRCQSLVGDRCGVPAAVLVPAPTQPLRAGATLWSLEVDLQTPWGDDHVHRCAGAQWADQVWRLHFAGGWAAAVSASPLKLPRLAVTVAKVNPIEDGLVSVAVRDPGCLPWREEACQLGSMAAPARVLWPSLPSEDLRSPTSLWREPLVFVDWAPERSAPIRLEFSVVDGAAD